MRSRVIFQATFIPVILFIPDDIFTTVMFKTPLRMSPEIPRKKDKIFIIAYAIALKIGEIILLAAPAERFKSQLPKKPVESDV